MSLVPIATEWAHRLPLPGQRSEEVERSRHLGRHSPLPRHLDHPPRQQQGPTLRMHDQRHRDLHPGHHPCHQRGEHGHDHGAMRLMGGLGPGGWPQGHMQGCTPDGESHARAVPTRAHPLVPTSMPSRSPRSSSWMTTRWCGTWGPSTCMVPCAAAAQPAASTPASPSCSTPSMGSAPSSLAFACDPGGPSSCMARCTRPPGPGWGLPSPQAAPKSPSRSATRRGSRRWSVV